MAMPEFYQRLLTGFVRRLTQRRNATLALSGASKVDGEREGSAVNHCSSRLRSERNSTSPCKPKTSAVACVAEMKVS